MLNYMRSPKGTIYKVNGANPLPVLDPTEQRNQTFRQHGFMALLSGAAKRRHVERLEADRLKALATIREARKVSGEVIADLGNGQIAKLTLAQALVLEKHLENAGQKLRKLSPMPELIQKETDEPAQPSTQPS